MEFNYHPTFSLDDYIKERLFIEMRKKAKHGTLCDAALFSYADFTQTYNSEQTTHISKDGYTEGLGI